MQGEKAGTIELSDAVFGLPWNASLIKQVVTAEHGNKRARTAHTKDRGEVSGGGKKPWRQKGTGRARHGSIRSPLWIGGGVTHGPRNERTFDEKINKRMRRKALLVSLSGKARDGELVVMEELSFPEGRTRHAAALFRALAASGVARIGIKGGTALVTPPPHDGVTWRAFQNIPHVFSCEARNLTARQILAAKYLVVPQSLLPVFESLHNVSKNHGAAKSV